MLKKRAMPECPAERQCFFANLEDTKADPGSCSLRGGLPFEPAIFWRDSRAASEFESGLQEFDNFDTLNAETVFWIFVPIHPQFAFGWSPSRGLDTGSCGNFRRFFAHQAVALLLADSWSFVIRDREVSLQQSGAFDLQSHGSPHRKFVSQD